jgi:hypothetical protein
MIKSVNTIAWGIRNVNWEGEWQVEPLEVSVQRSTELLHPYRTRGCDV